VAKPSPPSITASPPPSSGETKQSTDRPTKMTTDPRSA